MAWTCRCCKQLAHVRRPASPDDHYSLITLRFFSALSEQAYAETCKTKLVKRQLSISLLLVLGVLLTLAAAVVQPADLPEDRRFEKNSTYLLVATGGIAVGNVILTKCTDFHVWFSPFSSEILSTAVTVLFTVTICMADRYYVAKVSGVAFPAADACMSDSNVLLLLCMFVTCSHVYLPIRWLVLLPYDACVVFFYAALEYGIGGPEREFAHFYTLLLAVLVFTSLTGKRNFEKQDRDAFIKYVDEKRRRTELEFQLGQVCEENHSAPTNKDTDTASLPTTTQTQKIFQELGGSDFAARLQNIAALGKDEHWLIPIADLKLMPDVQLGSGGFGVVVGGWLHGFAVAVKIARKAQACTDTSAVSEIANELSILRHLRHRHIVAFYGACFDFERGHLALVLEWIDGMTLKTFICRREEGELPPLTESIKAALILAICSALQYLHGHKPCIIHGDLKSRNIMVEQPDTRKPQPKLLDFGLARRRTRHALPLTGTLRWMAPEIVVGLYRNQPCLPQPAADVFSFGTLCHFVFTGRPPLASFSRKDIVKVAVMAKDRILNWPGESSLRDVLRQLVGRCVSTEPQHRPLMSSIHRELLAWDSLAVVPGYRKHARCVSWQEGFSEALHTYKTPMETGQLADPDHLLYPAFQCTPPKTQMACLLRCMQLWNISISSASCCGYHAQVHAIQKLTNRLNSTGCRNSVQVVNSNEIQCSECMAMLEAEKSEPFLCHICGCTDAAPLTTNMSL